MKLAIISDCHFGVFFGTERENDSFDQAREALFTAIELDADAIILPGDVFDSKIPKPEVMARAMNIFREAHDFHLKKHKGKTNPNVNNKHIKSIPIIAIHGTHEMRHVDFTNPIQTMESAGLLTHLHMKPLVLSKQNKYSNLDNPCEIDSVGIFGFGGVPDKYVKPALESRNVVIPQGNFNIFVFHQTLRELIPTTQDMDILSISNLPTGFDLYINGHIHWRQNLMHPSGKLVLIPGSTVLTQMKNNEAVINIKTDLKTKKIVEKNNESNARKVFFMLDTIKAKQNHSLGLTAIKLKTQRDLYYIDLTFDLVSIESISNKCNKWISKALEFTPINPNKKPLIRLRIRGNTKNGENSSNLDLNYLTEKFNDKAIFSISKELSAKSFKEKLEVLRNAHKEKLSINELGLKVLEDCLEKRKYSQNPKPRELFELLIEGEINKILDE